MTKLLTKPTLPKRVGVPRDQPTLGNFLEPHINQGEFFMIRVNRFLETETLDTTLVKGSVRERQLTLWVILCILTSKIYNLFPLNGMNSYLFVCNHKGFRLYYQTDMYSTLVRSRNF